MSKLVAILNITPDSFSDGGKFNNAKSALKRAEILAQRADTIDIGAESTRPNAVPISAIEEWERLKDILPQVISLAKSLNPQIEISLDSRYSVNIAKGLDLGIDIINDVSGFSDEKMIKIAAKSGKKIILMHNLGVPADIKKIIPDNIDVLDFLIKWAEEKILNLEKAGILRKNIIFDPGIGFGKNSKQSIDIINRILELKSLKLPIFVGHSKKRFLEDIEIDGIDKNDRIAKTNFISAQLIKQNIEYIRIHDI